jgi:uncharacterized protein (DUF305 family)
MMRRRCSLWLAVAVLAAGCAVPGAESPAASDETDVWFMQHMAGHLLQTISILDLSHDHITRPKLARLTRTMNHQQKAHLQQLQGWLASRGLAAYDPQQQPSRKESDLVRLSRVRGARFDLALLRVLTARHRAGSKLAAAEFTKGTLPEVRQLAQQLLIQQRGQIATMTTWARTWAKADANHSTAQTSARSASRP